VSQVDKADIIISREELLSRGWKMLDLVPEELNQKVFQKRDKIILWDVDTQMIVMGTLDE